MLDLHKPLKVYTLIYDLKVRTVLKPKPNSVGCDLCFDGFKVVIESGRRDYRHYNVDTCDINSLLEGSEISDCYYSISGQFPRRL